MQPIESKTYLCIVSVRDKNYCNECFNALGERQRKGRKATPYGWVGDMKPNETCCKCGRIGYHEIEMEGRYG